MRIKRNTLEAERVGRRLFVLLNTELTTDPTHPDAAALISEMRARVDDLREQLEQANERDRENRRIIAALTQRIPAIEAPQETPESPETATDMPMGPTPPSEASEEAQEGSEPRRRSWWREFFGFE